MENNCKRYTDGKCATGDVCVGKECGAYEPKIDTRGTRNFDCHYFNGYTACCDLKGGECTRKCKDFKTESQYYDGLSEKDMRISVAKLREVLDEMASVRGVVNESVEDIVERVKGEI